MIEFGSVVPERENLTYYVINIQWFHRWQKYTGCFKYDEEDEDQIGSHDNIGEVKNILSKSRSSEGVIRKKIDFGSSSRCRNWNEIDALKTSDVCTAEFNRISRLVFAYDEIV